MLDPLGVSRMVSGTVGQPAPLLRCNAAVVHAKYGKVGEQRVVPFQSLKTTLNYADLSSSSAVIILACI